MQGQLSSTKIICGLICTSKNYWIPNSISRPSNKHSTMSSDKIGCQLKNLSALDTKSTFHFMWCDTEAACGYKSQETSNFNGTTIKMRGHSLRSAFKNKKAGAGENFDLPRGREEAPPPRAHVREHLSELKAEWANYLPTRSSSFGAPASCRDHINYNLIWIAVNQSADICSLWASTQAKIELAWCTLKLLHAGEENSKSRSTA